MPKTDYGKTVIYKIQHKELNELLYIGSTTNFRNRKVCHKSDCYNTKKKTYNTKLYTTIRENGGWDMFNMILVKEHPCENKRQKEAEEDKVMREMKASLNMVRAYMTYEEKLEYMKQYKLKNPDKTQQYWKQYRLENIDKLSEYNKLYKLENPDKIKELSKLYRERKKYEIKQKRLENIDKINEKFSCQCGGKYIYQNKSTHFKTKIHQAFINNSSN